MNTAVFARPLRTVARQPLVHWLVGFKATYLAAVLAGVCLWNDFDEGKFYGVMARWPREGGPVFASHFATWDAAHYLYLSEVGYHTGVPSCAFYPLWPLLVRRFAPLVGGSHVLAGVLLANAFSLAAWVLFHGLVARRWGESAANWALIFLIAFPGALFFQFNYTESPFLLLVLLLWWGLEEQRHGWAWLAASLLPLSRGVGVFAVLPIAWYALKPAAPWLKAKMAQASWQSGAGWMPALLWARSCRAGAGEVPGSDAAPSVTLPLREVAGRAWLLAAPLLGWAAYLVLMGSWTGNPFEGFEAQKYWGVHSIGNLWNVPKFVLGFFTPTEWHAFRGSVLDRCAFLLLLYCLPVMWRMDKGLLVWACVLGILPAMSGTFTSFTRFASCAFPMFIALGVFLGRREWRWPRYALLTVFVTLHVVLAWRFVNYRWAG